ncbi:hypothetical protein P2H44_22515 [Albimonas sp. CAU 1670]|uniref:hypothetical protein n=1 Tax=Albimonas sp. CAU 1670 TaxID=3032599 RepID=UPI0023DCBB0D|nr:hypothetical protein [Albimonas sp. CAU 1670]MDF2235342.1 hypothetical protein [Albimonas sp. CAU 1670]
MTDPGEDRPPPLGARLAGIRWGSVAGWLALVVVALVALGSWRPAVWPFKTYGAIYVDSPEVYTRERLVNDRYDQDHWLRNQLQALDLDPTLIARMIGESLTMDARAPAQAQGAAAGGPAPAGEVSLRELDFSDKFTIISGVRDRIRQMILENMLDDRHDLLGNTMYGFKFDTTVLPGANTVDRAFVRVHVSIERFFAPGDPSSAVPGLAPHLSAALQTSGPDRTRLAAYDEHYANWLANIEIRLNNFIAGYYALNAPGCPSKDSWAPAGAIGKEIAVHRDSLRVQEARLRGARETAEKADEELLTLELEAQRQGGGAAPHARPADPLAAAPVDPLAQARKAADDARAEVEQLERLVERSHVAIGRLLLTRDRSLVDDVTVRALQTVLSIPTDVIQASIDESEPLRDPRMLQTDELDLREPEPWRRFFDLVRKEVLTDCGPRPQFLVRKAQDTLYMIAADETGEFPDWARPYYYPVRTASAMQADVGEGRSWDDAFVAVSYDGQLNSLDEYAALVPRFNFPAAYLAEARARDETHKFCQEPQFDLAGCPAGRAVEAYTVNGGLFNLIEQLAKQDAYSYAIFPKSDAEGVLLRRKLEARAGLGGWLGLGRASDEQAADASAVLVGFGDSRIEEEGKGDGDGKAIEFGWVIAPPDGGDPVQRTQMALISVPAWADEVNFEVTTGWLDDDSRETIDVSTYPVRVPLPPDFEALDIVIWGGALDVQRRPIILDDFMDPPHGAMVLEACQPAAILIPGTRLWRSTAVTLGGQTASRIRVLPNMDGIVAEFGPVAPPGRRADDGGEQRILRVWTSEGSATSAKEIRVLMPEGVDRRCEEDAPER